MEIPEISIIIPYFNRWDLTHNRLMELYKFAPDNCEIILVDDCSTEAAAITGAAWWQKQASRHTVRYVKNKENIGFGKSINRGAKVAKGNILVFLNNDVIINGNFVNRIVSEIIQNGKKTLVGGRLVWWEAGWNQFELDGDKFIVPYLEGWLLSCTQEAWEELGGFDKRYGKFDYEDIDLSTKALSLGYNMIALNDPSLKHLSGVSIAELQIDRMEITKRNRELYWEKWKNEFPKIFENLEKMSNGERGI